MQGFGSIKRKGGLDSAAQVLRKGERGLANMQRGGGCEVSRVYRGETKCGGHPTKKSARYEQKSTDFTSEREKTRRLGKNGRKGGKGKISQR